MSFLDGFIIPHEPATGGTKYLDWEKAKEVCLKHPNETVYAGLAEDWTCTCGIIRDCGKWLKPNILFTHSYWATPILLIWETDEEIECWTHDESKSYNGEVPDWWGNE